MVSLTSRKCPPGAGGASGCWGAPCACICKLVPVVVGTGGILSEGYEDLLHGEVSDPLADTLKLREIDLGFRQELVIGLRRCGGDKLCRSAGQHREG